MSKYFEDRRDCSSENCRHKCVLELSSAVFVWCHQNTRTIKNNKGASCPERVQQNCWESEGDVDEAQSSGLIRQNKQHLWRCSTDVEGLWCILKLWLCPKLTPTVWECEKKKSPTMEWKQPWYTAVHPNASLVFTALWSKLLTVYQTGCSDWGIDLRWLSSPSKFYFSEFTCGTVVKQKSYSYIYLWTFRMKKTGCKGLTMQIKCSLMYH